MLLSHAQVSEKLTTTLHFSIKYWWQPGYAAFQLLYNWTYNFENIKEMYKQFCFKLLILKLEGWCSLSRNTTPCLLTLPRCIL